ncbi:MAG: AraC family transcriptional regulator [Acidobacteriota bacterium]
MIEIDHGQSEPPDVAFRHPTDPEATIEAVELSRVRSTVTLDHSIYRPHRIDFFQIFAVTEGEGRHWVDFEAHAVRPGTVLPCRPKQVHCYDPDSHFEGITLVFMPSTAALRLPQPRWPARLDLPATDFALLHSLLRAMLTVETGLRLTSRERIRRLLLPAVLEIVEAASLHSLDRGRGLHLELGAFRDLVDDHFAHHRQLSWYARRLGFSVQTLTRRCKQLTGRGAKQIVNERVVLEAKRRLGADTVKIDDLAHELGFSEPTNFVKFFRRHTGITPGTFRRSYEA